MRRIGIDVGSKTIKLLVTDEDGNIEHSVYKRHNSNIQRMLSEVVAEYVKHYGTVSGVASVTGSGGIAVARMLGLPHIQEVTATTLAVQHVYPQANAIIELGGEDAKVVFLDGVPEQRMNTTCAGGTGGFIDTIADMLGIYTREINMFAIRSARTYPLASRCAVFAQADVRALLNLGVAKEDIAASALDAVVRQTIGGLACGRPIEGTVVFLGGPFEYLANLTTRFCDALALKEGAGIRPKRAHLFTALGAALYAGEFAEEQQQSGADQPGNFISLSEITARNAKGTLDQQGMGRLAPLFSSEEELQRFRARHAAHSTPRIDSAEARGPIYVGIDAGAAAVKVAAVNDEGQLLFNMSRNANGDSLTAAADLLEVLYGSLPAGKRTWVARAAVTGSGDETVQSALHVDTDVVETLAHARAATWFCPDASFVLDAGGQDMVALWMQEGEIRDTVLNEPCSSGCGLFLEETANSLNWPLERFSDEALAATAPVELDTKCIVFMNSRLRHAQKIGASRPDIAAGLAYSIAQNAFQRVIGGAGMGSVGSKVVVQGGLFASDAILRAFELVSGMEVLRPPAAECMGAIGAALIACDQAHGNGNAAAANGSDSDSASAFNTTETPAFTSTDATGQATSTLADKEELRNFDPIYSTYVCPGCDTHCTLSVVSYNELNIYISGNRCTRGAEIVREESISLSTNDILGSSSTIPRSRGVKKRRNESTIGNGIVIPGYLRSFSGGMLGGGNTQGISEEPRRIDYYAIQAEKDRTRKRKVKIIASTHYMSAEEVARKKAEEAKSEQQRIEEQRRAEEEQRRKIQLLKVTSSTRTLKSESLDVPNLVLEERRALEAFTDVDATASVQAGETQASRARMRIGLVNTLNGYGQLPFWHTLLSALGYSVMVADADRCARFATKAAESIPSESVCDPAKATHARIYELLDRGADAIFMPTFDRHGRCSVLYEYGLAIGDNVPALFDGTIGFAAPRLSGDVTRRDDWAAADIQAIAESLQFGEDAASPSADEVAESLQFAAKAQRRFSNLLREKAQEAFDWLHADPTRRGVVLAARSYHTDAALLHDVDNKLGCMGLATFSPLSLDAFLDAPEEQGAHDGGQAGGEAAAIGADSNPAWAPSERLRRYASLAQEDSQLGIAYLHSFNCGYDSISIADVRAGLAALDVPNVVVRLDEMADNTHLDVKLRTLAEATRRRGSDDGAGITDGEVGESAGTLGAQTTENPQAGAPLACDSDSAPHATADILAGGISQDDMDLGRLVAPSDVCFTATSLIARAVKFIRDNPDRDTIYCPLPCKDCLTDALPDALQRQTGRDISIRWTGDWNAFDAPAASGPDSTDAPNAAAGAAGADMPNTAADVAGVGAAGSGAATSGAAASNLAAGSNSPADSSAIVGKGVTIGIVGNPLLCSDPFMNEGIVDMLQQLGATVLLPKLENLAVEDTRYLGQLDEFARQGADAVLYLQNFSCVKGHVHSRGSLHHLQQRYPHMPITVLDYDPESSALNRENRIRLVVSAARRNG